MRKAKRQRLENKGWKFGSAEDFLGLTPEESTYIDLKLRFGQALHQQRKAVPLTQVELAHRIHSSQSRVAKMERGDPSVSIDLVIRSLLALGASQEDLARVIGDARG